MKSYELDLVPTSVVRSIDTKSGTGGFKKKKAGQLLLNCDIKYSKSYENGTCL